MQWRRPLGNGALALASLALGAGAFEGLARAQARRIRGGPDTVRNPLARYDADLGWSKPPGGTAVMQRPEYRVRLSINSHGLRGPELPLEKPPGVRRVLLLGDSITEGYSTEEEHTLRALLEARLVQRTGQAHQVINGGTAGYSTDQEHLFYLRDGRRFDPDVVVLLFCYNDLLPLLGPGDGKPYFELDEQERLVLRNHPVPRVEGTRGDGPRRPFVLKPWKRSYALRFVSDRTAAGNPALHRVLARFGVVEPYGDDAQPLELWPYRPMTREVDEMWRRARAIVRELKADVEGRGARLHLFYVPARFEFDERAWQTTRERYRLGRRWRSDRVFEGLAGFAKAAGLPLVDPREAFRQAHQRGRLPYFIQDGHWTPAGNEIAARLLDEALRAAE